MTNKHLAFGVLYKTRATVAQLESWLDEHCDGDWHVGLEGLDTQTGVKSLRILFETEKDKLLFKQQFSRKPAMAS